MLPLKPRLPPAVATTKATSRDHQLRCLRARSKRPTAGKIPQLSPPTAAREQGPRPALGARAPASYRRRLALVALELAAHGQRLRHDLVHAADVRPPPSDASLNASLVLPKNRSKEVNSC